MGAVFGKCLGQGKDKNGEQQQPVTQLFNYDKGVGIYTTLLMSTGLTFGTISSLYGLTNNYINSDQYTVLVATVILSAVVPTTIAQKFFFPRQAVEEIEIPVTEINFKGAE